MTGSKRSLSVAPVHWLLGLAALLPHGTSGATEPATAVPCGEIVADGQFQDWPSNAETYRISGAPAAYAESQVDGEGDLSGTFRVCYDSTRDLVHVAVEVSDDTLVVGSDHLTTDACEVYLQLGAPQASSPTFLCVMVPGEGSYDTGAINPWYTGGLDGSNAGFTRVGAVTSYEFSIRIPNTPRGYADFVGGELLGFDVVLVDKDGTGATAWVPWGPQVIDKRSTGGSRLGQLHLKATN